MHFLNWKRVLSKVYCYVIHCLYLVDTTVVILIHWFTHTPTHAHTQDRFEEDMNCHSFQLTDYFNLSHSHENFTKIEKTLEINDDK